MHLQANTTSAVLGFILLVVSAIGVLSSTVFLGLVLIAARRHRRTSARAQAAADSINPTTLPRVCVLKPVHGLEPRLLQNLESFFRQDYPDYEIVFGTRTPDDPALTVVDELRNKYPYIPVRIVYCGEPEWPNAKVYSLDRMIANTRCEYLVISDSDVLVAPDFLRNVVVPLLERRNGLVTCLYRGIPGDGIWSELEAIGMSVEMPAGVLVADMLEGMKFALGAVMALRRDALDAIGGISVTADYYSDDFVLGNLVAQAGYKVVLSHYRVGHVLVGGTFRNTFATQLRWARSTRYSRPAGHIGEGLTYATPYGLFALVAATMLGYPALGAALALWSVSNRMIQGLVVGWGLLRDPRALLRAWLYPVRDFAGFFVWASSFLGGSTFNWRGELYRFTPGGRIVATTRKPQTTQRTVNVQ